MLFTQARMAAIFLEVFGDKLVTKNLVEQENLNRLPSPHELKGKIILKGRKRPPDERVYDRRRTGFVQQVCHLADLFIQ